MAEATGTTPQRKSRGTYLLVSLALGHTVVHWYQQLWPVIIPSIKTSLGLSDVQVGTLSSLKQFTTGPLTVPSRVLADLFRKWTASLLALGIASLGAAYLLVGLSSSYVWLLLTVCLLGIGTALWHPAAVASLSLRFPGRRASAIAVHGIGASVGDAIAPLGIGALLLVMDWRNLLEFHIIPAILIALVLWKALGTIYEGQAGGRPSLAFYRKGVKDLVRHRVVLVILGVNVFTGMARLSILTFLPVYLQEHLDYSTLLMGFHITLLYAMGAVSQPILGYLSDRFGRQAVLLPSLVLFGILYLALALADPGIQLGLVIGALGVFFYALSTVTQATVMDVASDRIQASTMGVTSFLGQTLAVPAPIIAGLLVDGIHIKAAFIYAGAMTLLGALLLGVIRVPRSDRPTPRIAG